MDESMGMRRDWFFICVMGVLAITLVIGYIKYIPVVIMSTKRIKDLEKENGSLLRQVERLSGQVETLRENNLALQARVSRLRRGREED